MLWAPRTLGGAAGWEASGSASQEIGAAWLSPLRERYPADVEANVILPLTLPESIRGHALNTSLASASRPPLMRMGTKRRREPSTDLTPILNKWLQFGLRVTALKDSIRQIQRRVILLRLRKASADGILSHITRTLHECAQRTPPPAFIGAF